MSPLVRSCIEAGCPRPAVHRGRCDVHRRTEAQRGYGTAWQRLRATVHRDRCVRCGATTDLVVDHVVNGDSRWLQVLCRSCNTAKRNRERGR